MKHTRGQGRAARLGTSGVHIASRGNGPIGIHCHGAERAERAYAEWRESRAGIEIPEAMCIGSAAGPRLRGAGHLGI